MALRLLSERRLTLSDGETPSSREPMCSQFRLQTDSQSGSSLNAFLTVLM